VSRSIVVLIGLVLSSFAYPATASAFPWMIKHGYSSCQNCHADPSGGELLTRYGRIQGHVLLQMPYAKAEPANRPSSSMDFDSFDEIDEPGADSEQAQPGAALAAPVDEPSPAMLWGLWDPPEPLLFGGSYRHMLLFEPANADPFRFFPMQADLYAGLTLGAFRAGASLGYTSLRPGAPYGRAALVTSGESDNLVSRSHWLGLGFGNGDVLLRAGRINLPFGLRIPEHTSWVRQITRTDRESSQQHGLALAFTGAEVRGEIMLIAGNLQLRPDRFRERGYSLFFEGTVSPRSSVGVSSLATRAEEDRLSFTPEPYVRHVHGVFSRLTLADPLVLMLETDVMWATHRDLGYTAFAQFDYEWTQGLHLLATLEGVDTGFSHGTATTGSPVAAPGFSGQSSQWGIWLGADWFFYPQMEARLDLVRRSSDPLQFLLQYHLYL
jgi:hypothetical protein